jgi:EAL domain-containing protein (putative c-di-GMP-specific phosphodiesterase class I)
MTSELLENIELERSLKAAIADDVLEPFLQPQVDIDTGEVVGMEALARWHHDGQWVSPARFIPVAEENGLIVELGRQQLSKLITNLQQWQAEGYRTVPVSVNFSALQFADPTFSDWLIATLDQSGLSRQAICVEITESVFLHDFKAANQVINDLHEAGIVFSLDDFGTGFSSLAYLSRLPFSILKIDQSFVQHILDDRRSANLVRSIIDMAGALDLSVIAEGVETEAQINGLRRMGCRTVQGFLTGRPVPRDQAASLLRGQSSTAG